MSLRPGKKHEACRGKGCPECGNRGWVMPSPKKRAPIPPKALGRALEDAEYARLRRIFLTKYRICQCRGPNGPCRNASTQVHHRRRRGPFYLDVSTWMSVCMGCHDVIEKNGIWAKAMGYTHSPISIQPLPPLSNVFIPYET